MMKFLIEMFMCKFLLFICLVFSISSYSQNLTLDEVVSLRKKDLANIEEFLTIKGWNFIKGSEQEPGIMGSATFAYNKNSYDDKAESFLNYYYSEDNTYNRISLQISIQEKYNSFITRIKSLGCKIISSKIVNGDVEKIYQGKTTTFMVRVSTQKNNYSSTTSVYNFLILDNFDYHVEYGE